MSKCMGLYSALGLVSPISGQGNCTPDYYAYPPIYIPTMPELIYVIYAYLPVRIVPVTYYASATLRKQNTRKSKWPTNCKCTVIFLFFPKKQTRMSSREPGRESEKSR
eukprot:1925087-Rhodomonas_salina.4